MRILFIDYGLCNFHNLKILAEAGHEVLVLSDQDTDKLPIDYYLEHGIELIPTIPRDSLLDKWFDINDIDLTVLTNPIRPTCARFRNNIGLSKKSCELETHKLFVRNEVEKLGIKVPKLQETYTAPCVIKPIIVTTGQVANICMTQEDIDKLRPKECYSEEYIPNGIETNVSYMISKGKWSILHVQEKIGEDTAKMAGAFTHWTNTSSFHSLSPRRTEIVLEQTKLFLDWAVQHCPHSSYVGQVTGLLKGADWYFVENNVRPEQTNSLPWFVTGDEWLESMNGKPEILGNAFPKDVQKMIVMPVEQDSIYPYHLHEQYNVSVPCGLDIIDGEYRVSKMMRGRAEDGRIGIVICDREIPQGFIDGFLDDDKFLVTALMK